MLWRSAVRRHMVVMARTPGRTNWSGLLLLGGFLSFLWLERRRPLRRQQVEPAPRRLARHFAMAALTAASIRLAERPLITPLAQQVERRRWGLLPRLGLPRPLEYAAAVVLLDYTLYWWHILLHKVPLLWRMHLVHHSDLELDASTAVRFHFTEFLASIPWRAAQVLLIGVRPQALAFWQKATMLEVLFHHSNLRLPLALERRLSRLLVTPRLHGIHHSIVQRETDSNFSSGLTVWDHLHGTIRMNVPQDAITIGVPSYRRPDQLRLPRLLAMPLENPRSEWRLPSGRRPRRLPRLAPRNRLLG
jgi:sterol desaturase/sphingolipid hydroxylase (fatty acid hydroxylase superfamily)